MLMPVQIFCCYAHEDELLLNKLKSHLRPLQRQRLIDLWYDRDISAGTDWEQEITTRLDTAQIVLLLVSPSFMDSDYCYSVEMKRAIERHERGDVRIIPIILRPVYWHGSSLDKLQALPTNAKPVKSWSDQDEAFYNVVEGIRKVIEQPTSKVLHESAEIHEGGRPSVNLQNAIPGLITLEQLDRILEVAVTSRLVSLERRPLLLASLPNEYIYSLPQHTIPLDQFRSDLLEMNTTPSLIGLNELPLVTWLKNAVRLTKPRPELLFFATMVQSIAKEILHDA
jgi:hypothetical protein